jgi:hypothetical protein
MLLILTRKSKQWGEGEEMDRTITLLTNPNFGRIAELGNRLLRKLTLVVAGVERIVSAQTASVASSPTQFHSILCYIISSSSSSLLPQTHTKGREEFVWRGIRFAAHYVQIKVKK